MKKEEIRLVLKESYEKYKGLKEGVNASYIPYLEKINPELCAISVVTVDGETISMGDDKFKFAIESISKVCTLALAMQDIGINGIRKKIGDSPTGLPFNSVIALELHKDKPLSPLVNAGAMATTSIIKAADKETRWKRILEMQRGFMNAQIELSEELNASEQNTNCHNKSIAWLLYSAHHMYCDPVEACEVYTRQCSTLVTSIDLATMAATLANKGINPLTKKRVIDGRNVPHILAEMTMEGLYDESGDFAYLVGLPGKSGVGGGLLAVVPGKLGIATFSPPLNVAGNSVRGLKMIRNFANKLRFNIFC